MVDSIQTVFLPGLESAPGSVSQVRECGARLMMLAKRTGMATFLVGHVTKEGALAGPRVLEHLVDTVLYFEGERHHAYRILRAVKNRFGSTNEIGVFEMGEAGLAEVKNPSGFFLSERPRGAAGSVVVSSLEGTRPLLLELQALVTPASFGTPRRTVLGADYNRVCLLLAVLEKRLGFPLQSQDAFVNVAGGGRVSEPAADLGIALAAASSYLDRPVRGDVVVMGEVGLTGEVRAVTALPVRLKEAAALGFASAVVPRNNLAGRSCLPARRARGGLGRGGRESVARAVRSNVALTIVRLVVLAVGDGRRASGSGPPWASPRTRCGSRARGSCSACSWWSSSGRRDGFRSTGSSGAAAGGILGVAFGLGLGTALGAVVPGAGPLGRGLFALLLAYLGSVVTLAKRDELEDMSAKLFPRSGRRPRGAQDPRYLRDHRRPHRGRLRERVPRRHAAGAPVRAP